MRIRAAAPEDLQSIMELAAGADGAAQWTRGDYEQIFHSRTPPRHCFIAEAEHLPLGFLVARELGPEWEIENLAVLPQARRRGIAVRLVCEAQAMAGACRAEQIFLEVRESNLAARALYEKLGFLMRGRRSAYYSDPQEDALVYRFTFPSPEK